MTSSSHLASSGLFYLLASAVAESPISVNALAATALGSLLPDIDTPTSSIGRPFFPLSSWIDRRIGHRTFTHSLLGILLFGLVTVAVVWLFAFRRSGSLKLEPYAGCLVLGYISHVLVDMLNKTGVELFWPAKLRCVFFYDEQFRITSAGRGDYGFMTVCLLLNLAAYPLARDGFMFSLHQAFGDIYSVAMDYNKYGDRNRLWLDLEGVEAISGHKVKGRFEILGLTGNASVLIERNRVKQIVARAEPFQIAPESARIRLGESHEITTREMDMAGRTLGELPRFEGASRVLLYGYLTPVKHTRLSVHQDRYDGIVLRLDKIKFEHAEYRDIQDQGLEDVAIREGVLIAKIYHSKKTSGPQSVDSTPPGRLIRNVELRFRPTDHILISVGDSVRQGQVIAIRDTALEQAKLKMEYQRDVESIQAELMEVELRLLSARRQLEQLQEEKIRLDGHVAYLSGEPLLIKDKVRIEERLAGLIEQIQTESGQIDLMAGQAKKLNDRARHRSAKLASDLAILKKNGEILASFTGKILRIERESRDHLEIWNIFHQPHSMG